MCSIWPCNKENQLIMPFTMCFSVMLAVINIARHNNDDKKCDPHTSIPCVASSVYVLLMTSQSIGVNVTMQSRDLTIVTWACEKRYLTRHISILFTAIFISSRVRKSFFISKSVSRIPLITWLVVMLYISISSSPFGAMNISSLLSMKFSIYLLSGLAHRALELCNFV